LFWWGPLSRPLSLFLNQSLSLTQIQKQRLTQKLNGQEVALIREKMEALGIIQEVETQALIRDITLEEEIPAIIQVGVVQAILGGMMDLVIILVVEVLGIILVVEVLGIILVVGVLVLIQDGTVDLVSTQEAMEMLVTILVGETTCLWKKQVVS